MKKLIIVSPHLPSSNLAGAQRACLLVPHLPEFGWEPTIVTVHHRYYEEKLDARLIQLIPDISRMEAVRVAYATGRPAVICNCFSWKSKLAIVGLSKGKAVP